MKLALAILILLCCAATLRSPKDRGTDVGNARMVRQVLPPAPPGYVAPSTAVAAPAPAPTVTRLVMPSLPVDIGPPIIGPTNICFPVLNIFTNAVILASTDLVHWTPFTNYCQPSDHMFFKLQH